LKINGVLDIATDVAGSTAQTQIRDNKLTIAVISLPLALIYQVKLNFARKLAIAAILCLSTTMIIIASIRLAFAVLPGTITDTVWLSFWQMMEATIGMSMVSIT
jgi:hypothetical protein